MYRKGVVIKMKLEEAEGHYIMTDFMDTKLQFKLIVIVAV